MLRNQKCHALEKIIGISRLAMQRKRAHSYILMPMRADRPKLMRTKVQSLAVVRRENRADMQRVLLDANMLATALVHASAVMKH